MDLNNFERQVFKKIHPTYVAMREIAELKLGCRVDRLRDEQVQPKLGFHVNCVLGELQIIMGNFNKFRCVNFSLSSHALWPLLTTADIMINEKDLR